MDLGGEVPESRVDQYYGIVERGLKRVDTWVDTLHKFPPNALRAAVRTILERFEMKNTDPATFDWASEFELLRDYDRVQDFIDQLEKEGRIPRDTMAEMQNYALSQLEEMADALGKRVISEKDCDKLTDYEQRETKLRAEIKRLREAKERAEKEKAELSKLHVTPSAPSTPKVPMLPAEKEKPALPPPEMVQVKILGNIPPYVSTVDGKAYGPFTQGQIITLNKHDATLLTQRSLAQLVVVQEKPKEDLDVYWGNVTKALQQGNEDLLSQALEKLRVHSPEFKV